MRMDEKEIRAIAYANKRMEEYPNMEEGSGYIMWKRFKDAFRDGEEVQEAIDDKRIKELESYAEKATALIEAEKAFREHLEAKEKNIIDKACEWLKANADKYIVDIGIREEKIIIGGMCWVDFRKAMEE